MNTTNPGSAALGQQKKISSLPIASEGGQLTFSKKHGINPVEPPPSKRLQGSPSESLLQPTSAFGKKYQGLVKLQALGAQYRFQVPPFIGISKKEARASLFQNKLPGHVEKFLGDHTPMFPKFMVRSSSAREDVEGQSNAGCFHTEINVQPDLNSMLWAIGRVLKSYSGQQAESQTSLYASVNHDAASPNPNDDGIVIQAMIGELTENNGDAQQHSTPFSIPVSGVGLSPDPRSRLKNSFNLTYALGHGDAVVRSVVATDQTSGLILSSGNIHARSLVVKQNHRLVPKATFGLETASNDGTPLIAEEKLTPAALENVITALQGLASQYQEGGDIEFVFHHNQLYLVQQRSQDVVNSNSSPKFLSSHFLTRTQANAHAVEIAVFSNYGIYQVQPHERIVTEQLDDAFYNHYLQHNKERQSIDDKEGQSIDDKEGQSIDSKKSIKAVFVQPPANPNSHAALMFRQQGISIIAVSNPATFEKIKGDQTLLMDEQQGLLFFDIQPAESDVVEGWTKYPAPALYSLPQGNTPLSQSEKETLQRLLQSPDAQVSHAAKRYDAGLNAVFVRLKQAVLSRDEHSSQQIDQCIAELLKKCYQLFKFARIAKTMPNAVTSPIHLLNRVTHECVIDLLRLAESVKRDDQLMQQMLYLNWIDAAINQLPTVNSDLVDITSIHSQLSHIKINQQFNDWIHALKTSVSGNPLLNDHLQDKKRIAITQFLFLCTSQLNNDSDKTKWKSDLSRTLTAESTTVECLIAYARQAISASKYSLLSESFNDCAVHSHDNNAFTLMDENFVTKDDAIKEAYQAVVDMSQLLNRLKTTVASSQLLTAAINQLADIPETLGDSLDALNIHDLPHQSMALIQQTSQLCEQIDLVLKSIVTNRHLSLSDRDSYFTEVLRIFVHVLRPLLMHAYKTNSEKVLHFEFGEHAIYEASDEGSYIASLEQVKESRNIKAYVKLISHKITEADKDNHSQLVPAKNFVVSEHLFSMENQQPIDKKIKLTLGDLHTLIHQNTRAAMAQLTSATIPHINLPDNIRVIKNNIQQVLINCTVDTGQGNEYLIKLTSIHSKNNHFLLEYAMPLREHGLRVIFDIDQSSHSMVVSFAMDGGNENHRWSIIEQMAANSLKPSLVLRDIEIGPNYWPNPETAPERCFRWVESNLNDEQLWNRITHHITNVIKTSFTFPEDGFMVDDHSDDHFNPADFPHEYRIFNEYQAVDEFNRLVAIGDINQVTDFIVNTFGFAFENKNGEAKSSEDIRANLFKTIQDSGVMEKQLGIFELGDLISSLYP